MKGTIDPVRLKGTRGGILVSLKEDLEFPGVMEALEARLEEAPGFFAGGTLTVDLGWREVTDEEFAALETVLGRRGLELTGLVSTSRNTRARAEARGHRTIIGRLGLAEHQGRSIKRQGRKRPARTASEPVRAAPPDATAESIGETAALVRRTMRSGQRVSFAGSVVVVGDVNPGAEVEAEGDILVFGNLRGVVHAGCKGRQGSWVAALDMKCSQLRIGDLIWLAEETPSRERPPGPTRARVVEAAIQLEAYSV